MGGMRVAVIGLGSMGLGAALSLLREGIDVRGCDLSDAQRNRFASENGQVFDNPAAAAEGAEAVLLMVVNAAQTEDALFGAGGIAKAMAPGGVIISSATMAPDDARALAAKAEGQGLLYLDAPVSGGSVKALAGEITVMASGSQEAFAAADPVLSAIAAKVYRLGDEAGLGSAYKIINQLLAGIHIAAACEAMTLASKLGLNLETVHEVITASAGNSWMFANRVPHILAGDYTPHSATDIWVKDLGILSTIAGKEKFPLPLTSAAQQMFLATSAAGMGRDDDASVARLIARITGVKLPGTEED
ncbi:NAD(P)-dependent oxidoreductase [Arsenicitalea aurantiaca]|uniref:L-threonate dehydrogenase n=1 Tax=Arsenicitalea aurantiaca TaxID=1783274 RepID=A0A433XFI8_9HYPH|nr:L-threonate dehydrogenase [Arsenicitalea aurantiaca]RUT32820.1 NAD(P)-dependent oxidoreductase [Arsenicitalea aurantiaca]